MSVLFASIGAFLILSAQAAAPWKTLFDGQSLDQWNQIGDANWRVAAGSVEADRGSGFLVTKESYGDFELKLEFWVSPDANSGVFIRCSNPKQVSADNAYEVNIFDTRPDPSYRTGGIVNVAKPTVALTTGNQWNTYEISAQGSRMTVKLNGREVAGGSDAKFARGPIALQYAAGTVRFRNVQIR
jgi:hypothetical protein